MLRAGQDLRPKTIIDIEEASRALISIHYPDSIVHRFLAFGLKLSVGRMCSCCARGVPHGWYSLKHSLQKLALQSAQPFVASSVWGGLQNWHITATLPRLTVCRYLWREEWQRETERRGDDTITWNNLEYHIPYTDCVSPYADCALLQDLD